MTDIEIPLFKSRGGKRTWKYRAWEILPGALSFGAIILLIVFSFTSPMLAAILVLLIVLTMFVRAIGIAKDTIRGRYQLAKSQKLPWREWLGELENPAKFAKTHTSWINSRKYGHRDHLLNLQRLSGTADEFPRPRDLIHLDFVAMVNEPYDVLEQTMQSLAGADYDVKKQLIVVLAYEERGGAKTLATVKKIQKHWSGKFRDLVCIGHPDGLPDEVIGKGPNLTYAGHQMEKYVKKHRLNPENIIVTSQDCDNHPDPKYFAILSYMWITTPQRQRVAFQPVALFTNNIWDASAPMRVIATSNSFWNIISTMRPHLLRNFASHAQGYQALTEMNWWSTRTIVEDGHQFWRSYFHFDGDYSVIPLRIGFGQDAVLNETFRKTVVAQFKQLRRWAYGCSDIAYVAREYFRKGSTVPRWDGFTKLFRLLDSHVTQALFAPVVAVGAWLPLWLNGTAAHASLIANDLPLVISQIQQIAMIGLFITIFFSLTLLPKRPQRYKKIKVLSMLVQWFLMPITALVYTSASAFSAQFLLMTGKYQEKFDLTAKMVKK